MPQKCPIAPSSPVPEPGTWLDGNTVRGKMLRGSLDTSLHGSSTIRPTALRCPPRPEGERRVCGAVEKRSVAAIRAGRLPLLFSYQNTNFLKAREQK